MGKETHEPWANCFGFEVGQLGYSVSWEKGIRYTLGEGESLSHIVVGAFMLVQKSGISEF